MKTTKLFLALTVVGMLFSLEINAQQWVGTTGSTAELYRTGRTGIGLTNPPNDTQLYVKSTNLKVGIVSETAHNVDFQFGMLSAVNRANTKAFAVLFDPPGAAGYSDTFVVFGDGRVRATEVRVKTPIFPDYVFASDYNLLPLSEVESFINTNKHLPNVPAAKEIVENGMEVGKMQVVQMEKIEELYLHVIQLEKRIKSLEEENAKLKK
jgi:hypothetical protein